MELADIEIFLALAEELHFGRAADRLHVSQSKVSKVIAALERTVGGALFDRTSRQVRLSELGRQFRDRVDPPYRELLAAADEVRELARRHSGVLRIGFIPTTGGAALTRLVQAVEQDHPGTTVALSEVPYGDPYRPLRDDAIDLLLIWKTGRIDPDLTEGPVIDRQQRVAAMAAGHPLAGRPSISVLDVDDWAQADSVVPSALAEAFLPAGTVDGTAIHRKATTFRSFPEFVSMIARGRLIHATVSSFAEMAHRDDLRYVPIRDLQPIELAVVRRTRRRTATISAALESAQALRP